MQPLRNDSDEIGPERAALLDSLLASYMAGLTPAQRRVDGLKDLYKWDWGKTKVDWHEIGEVRVWQFLGNRITLTYTLHFEDCDGDLYPVWIKCDGVLVYEETFSDHDEAFIALHDKVELLMAEARS